jgi:tetratricopeptide (TPR) repeat protein
MSLGLGLRTDVFQLDIAYEPYRDIGSIYYLGVTLGFPPSEEETEAKKKVEIAEHFEKGRAFYASGKYNEALNEFNQVLKEEPGNREAIQHIKDSIAGIEKRERQVEDRLAAGKGLFEQGKYETAPFPLSPATGIPRSPLPT